jgi:PAS domain S-box-containing protein
MKKFRDISIKTKLILIIIIVTIFSAIIGFTGIMLFEYDLMKSNLESEANMSAALVADFCVTPLSSLDEKGAEEALNKLDNIPFIVAAYIYDRDGLLFARYSKHDFIEDVELPESIEPIRKDTSYTDQFGFNILKSIKHENKLLGTIKLIASNEKLIGGLFNYVIMIGIVLLFITLISIFPATSLQSVISKPILALANLTQRISNNKDYSVRAEKYGNDEIGVLYDGFNNMLDQIEKRDRQRDIVELALRESEEYHRVLFETMTQGVIYFSPDGNIINANKAAEELFNMSSADMKQRKFDLSHWKVINEDGSPLKNDDFPTWIALNTGKRVTSTAMGIFNSKENDYRWVLVNAIPILNEYNNEIRRIYTTFNDFTNRKRIEEDRELLNKELLDKNAELEQIVYVTSHDLRSPLVNIQGFSNEILLSINELRSLSDRMMIKEEDQDDLNRILDIDIPESFSYIETSIHRMDALLKGLLKLSRYGRVPLKIETLDMNKLIENVLKTLEFNIKEKNITVRKDHLPICSGDEDQIIQVFSNIIGNAVKYMDIKDNSVLHITSSSTSKYNVYHVKDNGVGIEKEFHDKVFELFHRLSPSESQGEGLGLTIVKKIVERHKGRITLDSEPGKGTTFYIALPKYK